MNRKLSRWVKMIVLVYCGIGVALYYLQNIFLFHPVSLPRDYRFQFTQPFAEVEIPMNERDTLSMVQFFPPASVARKGVVLYFHGNRGNVNRYARFTENFTKQGFEVWMEDYPGFGKSVGERSEQILYQQASQVYSMASSRYGADSIIIYGKSFGTGIAAYLASRNNCRQLVLETPYYSIPDLFGCYAFIYPTTRMAQYKIPTNEYLQDVTAPVTIFHGTNDWVIPYHCAARLKGELKPGDRFITIGDGNHHNLNDYPLFHRQLDSLLR